MTRYGLIDGTKDTVMKIDINDEKKQIGLYLWNGKKWVTAPSEYSAVFIGEIQLTYIEEGDATWTRLNLQE